LKRDEPEKDTSVPHTTPWRVLQL